MKEAFKAYRRRYGDSLWNEVFQGEGLEVSDSDNAIRQDWYPRVGKLTPGSVSYKLDLRIFRPGTFDFVNVGEKLEHEDAPYTAALAWYHLLKAGGHMVITVPDYRLYESSQWPSRWNTSHKWSFSVEASPPFHRRHINIVEFVSRMPGVQIRRVHLADSFYNHSIRGADQTLGEAEASIEVVIRKVPINVRKRTFRHSGARGDLIYALPAIRAFGGGTLYVNRDKDGYFKSVVSDEEMAGIIDFLKTQSYLDEVKEWKGESVDCDLDDFRVLVPDYILLSESYLIRFGVRFDLANSWLDVDGIPAIPKADIVVSRSDRYHSPFDWGELVPWLDRSVFVGTKDEHVEFQGRTGMAIRHEITSSWKELAGVIRGSKLFIGNQSFSYSLAEAMKHPRVLEVCSMCPNCDPQGTDGHVRLSQGVIRKYLLGEPYEGVVRASRLADLQVVFSKKGKKVGYESVSGVIVGGGDKAKEYEIGFREMGAEVIQEEGATFEHAANQGVARTTRGIICVVDANASPSMAAAAAVIDGVLTAKAGLVAMGTSAICRPHVSGPCFALTRDAYERAGLFNPAMRSGEACMAEMCLRYEKVGVTCRSVGLTGWKGLASTPEDESRNQAYMARNYGVQA